MAKRQYDLYEGDGEVIGGEQTRLEESAEAPASGARPRRANRYFSEDVNEAEFDGSAPLFDDFDRYEPPLSSRGGRRPQRPLRHRGAWMATIVFCLLFLFALGLIMVPQLTGLRYSVLPNWAFANGSVIRLDEQTRATLEANAGVIYRDTIHRGVYIDDLHVGGMTREEAAGAVRARDDMSAENFNITVNVGNQSWQVNSERVPVSRNVEEVVRRAWALGRSNTTAIRGTGVTPLQQRIDAASALLSGPVSLYTVKTYDHEALRTLAEGIANYVNRDPVNSQVASFDFNTKTFTFTEDQPGARLDAKALYGELEALLDEGNYFTSIRVVPEKVLAEVTRAELMNSFGQISTYTTKTTSNKNRNTNIQLSAQAINATTVLPGETFSFNGATGERTAAKGYKEAAAISGGESRDEVGGGVCQTSSTLFNAVARANLEIVERSPHAWPSSYVEKGMDATVNWPGLDFRFRNNTDWPVFIIAGYADRKVTVSIYGMSLGADVRIDLESQVTRELARPSGTNYVINTALAPGESKKTVTGRKGYIVDTYKVWYHAGRETKRELLFTSTYKAYQETVEYNPQ